MKVRDLIKRIEDDGWRQVRTRAVIASANTKPKGLGNDPGPSR